jgi:hypothetical protein
VDKTSSYQAAQQIEQGLESSVSDIYFQAITVTSEPVRPGYEDIVSPGDVTNNAAGGGGKTLHPFQVYKQDSNNIRVNGGTVGGIAYATPNTDIAISSNKDVYIDVTVNNSTGQPTAVTVSAADTKPSDTSTHAYILISQVTVSGGEIEDTPSFIVGSLGYGYGGGTFHLVWRG